MLMRSTLSEALEIALYGRWPHQYRLQRQPCKGGEEGHWGRAIRVEAVIPCVVDLAHIYPDCLRYANSVGWQMSWDPGGRVVHWRVLGWR